MKELEISRSRWSEFVETFTRQHQNWLTTVQVIDETDKTRVLAKDAPLDHVMIRDDNEIHVGMREGPEPKRTIEHIVQQPRRMVFEETEEGAHKGMRIESKTGVVTYLKFRKAALPEQLDGMI